MHEPDESYLLAGRMAEFGVTMAAAPGERDGDGDGNGADGRQDLHTASTPSPCQLHGTRISTGCTDSDSTGP